MLRNILYTSVIFAPLIPLSVSIYYFRRRAIEIKYFAGLMLLTSIVEISTYILFHTKHGYFWLQHVYTPLEFIFWTLIFYTWIPNLVARRIFVFTCFIFVGWNIFNIIRIENFNWTNDIAAAMACALYVAASSFAMIYFQRNSPEGDFINHRYLILAGLLLSSAGSLSYFAFVRQVASYTLFDIHQVLNDVSYALYTAGIIWLGRRT